MNRSTLVRSAALALIGACAPLASAEPWFRFQFGGDRYNPGRGHVVVRSGPIIYREPQAPVFVRVRRVDVVPCDLRFAAYQSGDTVIIVATGANRSAGFTTSFSDGDRRDSSVMLCNLSADTDCAAQVMTPFALSASIHARHNLRCITVYVAGQCFEVPVTQTQCLS